MREKIFKNLDEQINILKDKGLIIKDEKYAKDILLRENYFFLNGYRYPFIKSFDDKTYKNNVTFEELYSLFLFDRKLRNILFKNILIIENNVKSIISYQLSKKYGYKEKDYLDPKNYNYTNDKKRQVNDLLGKMKRQISANVSQHSATAHYTNNYGYIPMWILVKVLSFGIVSELFTILKKEDQYDIVALYGIESDTFASYLSLISNYRNLCAHEDIVYENRTNKYINDTYFHRALKIPIIDEEYVCGKNDLFALIIALTTLLKDEEVKSMIVEIEDNINNLDYNLNSISIDKILVRMGFPKNYKDIIVAKEELTKQKTINK